MGIARMVYGDKAQSSYKSLRIHLRGFEKLGIVRIAGGRENKVFLTDEGLRLCKEESVEVPSKTAKEFIRILNNWVLTNPLAPEEESRLYGLLTDRLREALIAISDIVPLPLPENLRERYFDLKPSLDVWRCLRGVWTYEEQLQPPSWGGKHISVAFLESSGLKRRADDLLGFLNRLAFENPTLSELRDRVKATYLEERAGARIPYSISSCSSLMRRKGKGKGR